MSTSSIYSSVLSIYSDSSNEEAEPIASDLPTTFNPYSKSLWINTRGEVGNTTIKAINEKITRENTRLYPERTHFTESYQFPKRTKSLDIRIEDSKHEPSDDVYYIDDIILEENQLLSRLRIAQTYRKYLHTKYAHILTSKMEYQVFGDLTSLIELSLTFVRLLQSHGIEALFSHIKELQKVRYPDPDALEGLMDTNVWDWLDECEFNTKMRLSYALNSPEKRLQEYLKIINSKLLTCDDQVRVTVLHDEKRALEGLIDSVSRTHDVETEDGLENLVSTFNRKHHSLTLLFQSFQQIGLPMLKFLQYQKNLTVKWERFMEYEDDCDERYIRSIYQSYLNKLGEQESTTHRMVVEFNERVLRALGMMLESCENIGKLIKRHKSTQQRKIKNLILDELPDFLSILAQFEEQVVLMYIQFVERWFCMMCDGKKLKIIGDNFDIIEMYAMSKYTTKQAMKEFKGIPESKVVRRLFGV